MGNLLVLSFIYLLGISLLLIFNELTVVSIKKC